VAAAPKLPKSFNTTASVKNQQCFKMSRLAIRTTFEPRLYYLPMYLLAQDGTLKKVSALVDTGCAKSAMSKATYLYLKQHATNLTLSTSNAKIETCDGTSHNIMGFVNVTITFDLYTIYLEKIKILWS